MYVLSYALKNLDADGIIGYAWVKRQAPETASSAFLKLKMLMGTFGC
jgi:hypothetical protein